MWMGSPSEAGVGGWFWERGQTSTEQGQWEGRELGRTAADNIVAKVKHWQLTWQAKESPKKALNLAITWVKYILQFKIKSTGETEDHEVISFAKWKWWMPPSLLYNNWCWGIRGLKRNRKRCISERFPEKKIIEHNNGLSMIESEKRELLKKWIYEFWAQGTRRKLQLKMTLS